MPISPLFNRDQIDTVFGYYIRFFIVLLLLTGTYLNVRADSGVEAVFTDNLSVPGWKLEGQTYRYVPQNLYEYINGGAYFFIGYGFVELTGANYSPIKGERDAVTVDIYDMGDKLNAFGVFQLRKDPQAPSLNIGIESFGSGDYVVFHKDRFYVEIRVFLIGKKDESILKNMGSTVAENLPGDDSLPKELAYLPEKKRIVGSERYIRGGILGHAFLDRGIVSDYQVGDEKVTAFIAFMPSSKDAVNAVEQHKTFLKQSEKKCLPLEGFGEHSFVSEEPYHQKIIVIQEGARVIGVYDLNDIEIGKTLLADIRKRLR